MTTQDKWLNLNEDFLVIFVISLGSKKKTECPTVQTTFQRLDNRLFHEGKNVHFFLSFFSVEESPVQKQLLIRDKFRTKTRKISRIVAEKGLEGLQDKAIEPAS